MANIRYQEEFLKPWVALAIIQGKCLRKHTGQQNFQLRNFINSACLFQGGE